MQSSLFVVDTIDQSDSAKNFSGLLEEVKLNFLVDADHCCILVARNQHGVGGIGILVAEKRGQSTMFIKWLHVKKLWRKLSVASVLIQHLESYCLDNGISTISVMFDQKNDGMHSLTRRTHGWSAGEMLAAYTFSAKGALAPALIRGESAIEKRNLQACIVPLSECDHQDILRAAETKDLPEWAQLDQLLLGKASQELSRVFYCKNHIVGWLITFPLTTDTLEYRILWVDQEHRQTGIIVRALVEVMRAAHLQQSPKLQHESGELCCPWRKGFFMVHAGNQGMINWSKKRLSRGKYQEYSLMHRKKIVEKSLAW